MLNFLTSNFRDCERVSRRGFLQIGSLAGLGVSLPMALAANQAVAKTGAPSSGSDMT